MTIVFITYAFDFAQKGGTVFFLFSVVETFDGSDFSPRYLLTLSSRDGKQILLIFFENFPPLHIFCNVLQKNGPIHLVLRNFSSVFLVSGGGIGVS